MRSLADVKHEWHCFRDDEPGHRFQNHRERMKHRSRKHSVMAVALGVVLLASGVVLLFIPGPGLLLIVFGLALIASHSTRLSALLDRTEPRLRAAGHAIKQRWQAMPGRAKLSVLIAIAAVTGAVMLAMWKLVVSAYVLG
jgi:hypothetical protein